MDRPTFPPELLSRWRQEQEVHVETSAGSGAPAHRTIIWIVVDESGRALIRSHRGPTARWYREALATGSGAILAGEQRTSVTFERAVDPERVAACSVQLTAKYAGDPATPAMLAEGVLDTTLELHPQNA